MPDEVLNILLDKNIPQAVLGWLHEFPVDLLEAIKWEQSVDLDVCATALKTLPLDIFLGQSNSLCQ